MKMGTASSDLGALDAKRRQRPDAVAIGVHDLRKRYGSIEAVHGISLEVTTGEIFGLIGPDGAGKTSTFQILAGVMEATSSAPKARAARGTGLIIIMVAPRRTTQGSSQPTRQKAPKLATPSVAWPVICGASFGGLPIRPIKGR